MVDEDKVWKEPISTFMQYCLALENKDYARAFSLEPRYMQKAAGSVKVYKGWWSSSAEHDKWRQLYAGMKIRKVEILTPKRVAILIDLPDERMANVAFYMIHEDGKWKVGCFKLIFMHAKTDLERLNDAIVHYNEKKKRLPAELSVLTPEYIEELPSDLFNDKMEPYRYAKEVNGNYIIYSFGPDSDDDLGMVEYDYEKGLFNNGDIIIRSQ